MKSKCLLIDACQSTPYYNNCLLDALVKKGQKVVYATTPFPHAESPIPPDVEVRYCFFYLARLLGGITSSHHLLRRVLRAIEYPFDLLALVIYVFVKRIKLVHYMWATLPTFDLCAMWLLKKSGCKIVYTAHDPFPHEFKKSHLKKFARIYHRVDHIIALTEFTRNELRNRTNIPLERISIIPHGDFDYVLSQCSYNEALAEKIRASANGRKVITFLGRILPYKGLQYFIQAFSSIKRLKPDTFFLVAGSARFVNKKKWKEMMGQSCEPEDLYLDLRYFPVADMKAYLAVTDVLVLPCVSGASQSGNTIMAYSSGIPVISTDVGGLAEMVEDGQSGYVVPPKNPQAIAEAVAKCIEPDNYMRMSENARRLAADKYSWDNIAEQTIEVYRKFITG